MKRQRKRLVPGRPHRPATVRWSPFLGWHRALMPVDRWLESRWCKTGRPEGQRGRRAPLPSLP